MDPNWSRVRSFVPVVNQNCNWPVVLSLNITNNTIAIIGTYLYSFQSIIVNSYAADVVDAYFDTTTQQTTIVATVPSELFPSTFLTISLYNSDGGYVTIRNAIYYGVVTDSDSAIDSNCFNGAVCLADGRVYPKKGYWAPDTSVGWVEHCNPVGNDRCAGGPSCACGQEYWGEFCALCKKHYFEMAEVCQRCEHPAIIVLYWTINLLFWAVYVLSSWFLPTMFWNMAGFLIPVVQLIRVAAQLAPFDIPTGLRYIYSYFSLLTFDIEFLHIGCMFEHMKWHHTFYINWLVILVLLVLMVSPVMLYRFIAGLIMRNSLERVRRMYDGRMARNFLIWCISVYWIVAVMAFKSWFCISTEFGTVMYFERSQRCDSPEHIIVLIISAFSVLILSIGVPIFCMVIVIIFGMFRNELGTHDWRSFFGPWYNSIRSIFFLLWTNAMMLLFIALAAIFIFTPKIAQFIISTIVFTLFFVLVVIFLPFDHIWKNVFVAFFFAFACILEFISLATSHQLFHDMTIPGSVIMWAILPIIWVIAIIAIVIKVIVDKIRGKGNDERSEGVQGYFMKEIKRDSD